MVLNFEESLINRNKIWTKHRTICHHQLSYYANLRMQLLRLDLKNPYLVGQVKMPKHFDQSWIPYIKRETHHQLELLSCQKIASKKLQDYGPKKILQLSVFTLCTATNRQDIDTCSESHVVQALYYRISDWDALSKSNPSFLIKGVNLQKYNLNFAGKLTQREEPWSSPFLHWEYWYFFNVFARLIITWFVLIFLHLIQMQGTWYYYRLPLASYYSPLSLPSLRQPFHNVWQQTANSALAWTSFTWTIFSLPILGLSRLEKVSSRWWYHREESRCRNRSQLMN